MQSLRHLAIVLLLAIVAMAAGGIHGKINAGPPPKALPGAFPPPPPRSVVWAVGPDSAAPSKTYVMDQKWTAFQPHVLVVPVGSTVRFKNNDTVKHNVYWHSIGGNRALAKNLGNWNPGQSVSFRFTHPGVVHVRCQLHPDMGAYVVIVPTPYFTISKRSGAYTLKNLPPGRYRVVAWHERRREQSRSITVGANETTVNFKLAK